MEKGSEDQLRRAEFLLDARRPGDALKVLAAAIASDPGDSSAHLLVARCLLALEQWNDAVVAANQAASGNPQWTRPHILRSVAYRQMGDYQSAKGAADTAVRLAPLSAGAHMALGQAQAYLGNNKEALDHAREAVALAPGWSEVLVSLSFVASKARRWRECEEAAREALAIDPNSSVAMNNLGLALQHRRHPLAAIKMYGGAVHSDPTWVLSRGNANRSVLRLGGWLLCFTVATVVLLAWVLRAPKQLSFPALLAVFGCVAGLTVILIIGAVIWFRRLPRAVHRSLRDTNSWIHVFNKKPEGLPSVVGRIVVFLVLFFGVPLLFALVLTWNVLWVIHGSELRVGETPAEPLIFPGSFLLISLGLRVGVARSAMTNARGSRSRRTPTESSR